MRDNPYDQNAVLASIAWECGKTGTFAPVAAGHSGARVWRLEAADGEFCVRRWPKEHPSATQLLYIHAVLSSVFKAGFALVPLPIATRTGTMFQEQGGFLWEITNWLPGQAILESYPIGAVPEELCRAAMSALAEFHAAAESDRENRLPNSRPEGIARRLNELTMLRNGGLNALRQQVAANRKVWPALAERGSLLLGLFDLLSEAIERLLIQASALAAPIRPCIRDIHREHVLFENGKVSGIVDFGAMQPDNPAGDVARLLGSMAGNNRTLWAEGLAAFTEIRPLFPVERLLVRTYDESGVLLSGIHWLRWVFMERREFENANGVLARFDAILERLRDGFAQNESFPV